VESFMNYEQVKANDMIRTIKQPGKGMVKEMGIPVKPALTPGSIKGPAARPGQHTGEILRKLGYRAADIKRLKQEKIAR
jgi:crotonobetainyl-CoA:carnitine CoA-transferase CaiB-like acyl-CoA transferase